MWWVLRDPPFFRTKGAALTMKIIKTSIFILLVAFAMRNEAAEIKLVINGVSYHVGHADDFNYLNVGIGAHYCFNRTNYIALGVYKNSESATSYYAGYGEKYRATKKINIGYEALVVTGYATAPITPAIMPTVWAGDFKFLVIPKIKQNKVWTIGVQWEYN